MVMLMLLMIVRCYGDDADVADEASCKPAYVIIVVMMLLLLSKRRLLRAPITRGACAAPAAGAGHVLWGPTLADLLHWGPYDFHSSNFFA